MIKKTSTPTGSILIWTVLLGITLMTVFFYFSQRLNLNMAVQNKTIERQNAEAFLSSYANYLQSLPAAELTSGQIDFQGITGFVSNVKPELSGVIDAFQTLNFEVKYGKAKVEWANCAQQEQGRPLEVTPHEGLMVEGNCGTVDHDGVTEVSSSPFFLKAGEAPVSYRITPLENALLYDSTWTMDLQLSLSKKKVIRLHRTFVPS